MGLKELRLKRGMTQRELAQRSGVHHVEIAQIETGKRNVRAVSLDTALRLCDALRVANPRKLLDRSCGVRYCAGWSRYGVVG